MNGGGMERNEQEERAHEDAESARRHEWHGQSEPGSTPWVASGSTADTITGTEVFYGAITVLLVLGAVVLFVIGFTEDIATATSYFAAAAVLGILARMAQAARHHLVLRRRS
jgi:hypothetical protein